ncbi:MAG: rRNA (cytosine1402-N4)-methyltransferase, partial [Nocardioidaceae bacterium]|nr:rRNA (cytosine1402-N4)-methyltransferase [Nocardioidaceae bacterium]
MSSPSHVPVLLDRVVALLTPSLGHEGAVLIDATLGLGGHTEAVLGRCELARVVGIDRDPEALRRAGERLASYGDRFTGVHATYDAIPEVLADLGLVHADAVLFDLGVSSMQLDVRDRGFAYREDAPLDMRMDPTTGPT